MLNAYSIVLDLTWPEFLRFSLYMLPRIKMIRRLFLFVTGIGLLAGLLGATSFFLIHVKENKTDNVHVIQKRMLSREDAEGFRKFIERNMPL